MNYLDIINTQNYKEYFPADKFDDDMIITAINLAGSTVDMNYTGGTISNKWALTEANGGFDNKQKGYIKQAFLIQTRYNLQTRLQLPQMNINKSNGSQSLHLGIPNRDVVYRDVIYCLENAGLTNTFNTSNCECDDISVRQLLSRKYQTREEADRRYIHTQYTLAEGQDVKKNRFIWLNEDAEVRFLTKEEFLEKLLGDNAPMYRIPNRENNNEE